MTKNTEVEANETPDAGRYGVLVRGRVYYLKNKLFERGKPMPVTPEEEAYLKEHAVDEVTVEDEYEHQPRQKFKFLNADEVDAEDKAPAPTGNPPARRRRR